MNLFFDTSALVKIFHKEIGSETVVELIGKSDSVLWMSELAKLEFVSALHRKLRMGEIAEHQLEEVLGIFGSEQKRFRIEPLGSGVLAEADKLIRDHARTIGLRTLDALHLATFRLISQGDWQFVVADKVLAKVAAQLKLPVLNPLEK